MIRWLRKVIGRLASRTIPSGGVAEQTVKSSIWVAATKFGDRGLQLVMFIVLARLLSPRDFGLLGIALLTVATLRRFSRLGLEAALIQREESNIDQYLNTAWCLELIRGAALAMICFIAAPYIASFFGEPRTTNILRVIALGPLFHGLRNPAVVYFRKDLDFHKEFVYRISGSVTNVGFAIVYALIFANVWALILGYVIGKATRCVISYLMDDYRPWPQFSISRAKELVNYGKWITGSSMLYFLYDKGDDAVVGWALSATALGFYQVAYELSNAPATEISKVIQNVMFSAFSQVQNEPEKLKQAYYQLLQVTSVAAIPMAVGIVIVTPSFVEAFLGEEWLPMVTTMQLLAIYGLCRSIAVTASPLWKGIGRPDYITKLMFLRVVLMAIFIYPVIVAYGIEGAAFLVTGIYIFPMLPLDIHLIVKSIGSTHLRFLREIMYPITASTVMALIVLYVNSLLDFQLAIVEFFSLIAIGIVGYLIAVLALWSTSDWNIDQNILMIIDAFRG